MFTLFTVFLFFCFFALRVKRPSRFIVGPLETDRAPFESFDEENNKNHPVKHTTLIVWQRATQRATSKPSGGFTDLEFDDNSTGNSGKKRRSLVLILLKTAKCKLKCVELSAFCKQISLFGSFSSIESLSVGYI